MHPESQWIRNLDQWSKITQVTPKDRTLSEQKVILCDNTYCQNFSLQFIFSLVMVVISSAPNPGERCLSNVIREKTRVKTKNNVRKNSSGSESSLSQSSVSSSPKPSAKNPKHNAVSGDTKATGKYWQGRGEESREILTEEGRRRPCQTRLHFPAI